MSLSGRPAVQANSRSASLGGHPGFVAARDHTLLDHRGKSGASLCSHGEEIAADASRSREMRECQMLMYGTLDPVGRKRRAQSILS